MENPMFNHCCKLFMKWRCKNFGVYRYPCSLNPFWKIQRVENPTSSFPKSSPKPRVPSHIVLILPKTLRFWTKHENNTFFCKKKTGRWVRKSYSIGIRPLFNPYSASMNVSSHMFCTLDFHEPSSIGGRTCVPVPDFLGDAKSRNHVEPTMPGITYIYVYMYIILYVYIYISYCVCIDIYIYIYSILGSSCQLINI